MHSKYFISVVIGVCIILNACIPAGTYQKEYHFANKQWSSNNICKYKVRITDTASKYNLLFLLKHTYKYPVSNIWVKLLNTNPLGKTDTLSLEIPLALPTDGEWMGRRMNNIVEHIMNIGPNGSALKFNIPGEYNMQIIQDMRIDPLPEVMSTGLALEKTK
jgi:gliding motility-associated lipoprotein GldH